MRLVTNYLSFYKTAHLDIHKNTWFIHHLWNQKVAAYHTFPDIEMLYLTPCCENAWSLMLTFEGKKSTILLDDRGLIMS
jgi:hypothetical protein